MDNTFTALVFLLTGAICFLSVLITYSLYILLVVRTERKEGYLREVADILKTELPPKQWPVVSIVMATYDEEQALPLTLRNISALDYPRERLEMVIVDDCSTDGTVQVAQTSFNELELRGRIITNPKRIGVNACLNLGCLQCTGDLIMITDADVLVGFRAMKYAARILMSAMGVGGVTGRLIPSVHRLTSAVVIEAAYRDWFDVMAVGESSIHSTFPGNGALIFLRRKSFTRLPERFGSSDGNISLGTIRSGSRFVFVPGISVEENTATTVSEQRKQKTRRASRLIQSTVANRDMLFNSRYGSFGRVIFPLRFVMLILCPPLLIAGVALVFGALMICSMWLGVSFLVISSLMTYLGTKVKVRELSLFSSFVAHQLYLVSGLVLSSRVVRTWKPVAR